MRFDQTVNRLVYLWIIGQVVIYERDQKYPQHHQKAVRSNGVVKFYISDKPKPAAQPSAETLHRAGSHQSFQIVAVVH